MKCEEELLNELVQTVGEFGWYFLKLKNGEDWYGEVDLFDDRLQFDSSKRGLQITPQDIDINHLYYWDKQFSCFIHARWSPEQQCWRHSETYPGSVPLPTSMPEVTEEKECLKTVGFWQSHYPPGFSSAFPMYYPHPKYLIKPGWRECEHDRIVAYLKSGHKAGHYYGYSDCRLCCIYLPKENVSELEQQRFLDEVKIMGCHDLCDGEWLWPEGLAHYVEKHDVCLPDAFVETMQKNAWGVPSRDEIQRRRALQKNSKPGVSSAFWINWAIEYLRKRQK